ncbi:MFS transporter [Cohnella kolymensis]|uniref:MFS transporter n=1 Tax=Cohnella kolymensis TaxID=1590652 RepID=A0ABR5A1Z9_9BACL|nr:MFS transporter [Cohnella kolymensis]KIL35079.1 MFS transporter [Cohnella kolymensis]
MSYRSNLWKLYAIRFFHNLIPAYVIERLFWEERGMTIQMVVYAEIIYAVTIVLLEVPTGILADKRGRKQMIVLSALLGCCEFLILVFATVFWHFAAVVFLAGIARSASSGAENALLYDSLLLVGREQHFEKHLGRLNVCDLTSAVLAALCGSLLASRFGFELNYWISFASMSVSLPLALMLVEPPVKSSLDEPIPVRQYLKTSVLFFHRNPGVRMVLLTGMIIGSCLTFIDEFWQIYLNRLEIPVVYFGTYSAGLMLLRVPGNLLAHIVKNRLRYRPLLLGVTVVVAAGYLCISVYIGYAGLASMLLICLMSSIVEPVAAGYLHHRIDSSMRATIDSFQLLGENMLMIITGLGFGYFSSQYDIFGGYGFLALVCGVFLVYFAAGSRKV